MTTIRTAAAFLLLAGLAAAGEPPKVGDTAADFALKDLKGREVKLSTLATQGPVVLVVLRGWPGYQCPLCTAQVGELVRKADEIKAAGAQVLLVYPGPSKELQAHAEEFIGDKLPAGYTLVIDPDYAFTKAYNLRWDEPKETAYPSTFVVGKDLKVGFAKVSKSHAGRSRAADVIAALKKAS